MIVDETIEDICRQIVRNFNPEKIILFGSHAYGTPNADSDLDFLVIMPYTGNELQQMADVRKTIRCRVPLDVLVKTPEQVDRDLKANNFFTREIIEKGRMLYESGNLGMGK